MLQEAESRPRGTMPSAPAHHQRSRQSDHSARQQRQIDEIIRDTQYLLAESPYVRQQFMKKLY